MSVSIQTHTHAHCTGLNLPTWIVLTLINIVTFELFEINVNLSEERDGKRGYTASAESKSSARRA